jgi:hypothetical protein
MWIIDKTPVLEDSKTNSIHFFGLGDLNLNTLFFRTRKTFSPNGDIEINEVDPENEIVLRPTASSFLYYFDDLWEPIEANIVRVKSLFDLQINTYFYYLNRTYVIADSTPRTFRRKKVFTVVDPINFGFVKNDEIVNRVMSGGLDLDFSITADLKLQIETTSENLSRGCFARVGQQAEIWLEKQVDPTKINQINPIVFFSKEGTGIAFALNFDYLGYNYSVNSENQLATLGLVNVINNEFFIIQPYREIDPFNSWPFWNQYSVWNDTLAWSDV